LNGFSQVTIYCNKLIILLLLSPCFFLSNTFAQNTSLKSGEVQDSSGYYFIENIKSFIEKDSLNKAEKLLENNEKLADINGDEFIKLENSFIKAKLYYKKGDFNESLLQYQKCIMRLVLTIRHLFIVIAKWY